MAARRALPSIKSPLDTEDHASTSTGGGSSSRRTSRGGKAASDYSDTIMSVSVIRIPPREFIHVLNTNTNVTSVICGPRTFTRQDHEKLVYGPEPMITVPPSSYVVIGDPVIRDDDGAPLQDEHGQFRLRFGDSEIRMVDKWPDPFPLYPGESQVGTVRALRVVDRNVTLRLRASRTFVEPASDGGEPVTREAGDEWLFVGPGTYIPRVDVDEVELVEAPIIHHNEALRLRARRQCVDSSGTARNAGEEWLVREPGAYCALVDEIVLEKRRAAILTDKKALHMRASTTFTDVYDQKHRAGDEWLVTSDMTGSHITDVHEEVVGEVSLTTLTNRQFVVIVDPYVEGVQRLGSVELRKGEASFFLKPGESMRDGIEDVVVLNDDEALLLTAVERFMDPDGDSAAPGFGGGVTAAGGGGEVDSDSSIVDIGDIKGLGLPETTASKAVRNSSSASVSGPVERRPGDVWCVYGPRDYIPPVEVEVIERRKAIALDENEGIYVRDKTTGKVRAVIGETYMLRPSEELFEKELTDEVEALLERQRLGQAYIVPGDDGTIGALSAEASARDRTRVVSFRVPFGAACQVYDYGKRKERVIFGPNLVMLGPEEQLSVIRLSGGTPKKPNCIRTLTLMLGPDFATDVLHVETADHARLQLTLSYNWHFDVAADETDPKRRNAPFAVRDFVGDMTKSIASRVRGAVASETFDAFHKHSTRILRASVFGLDESGSVRDELRFEQNSLVVTSLDVKAVEPVDDRTRESLQKSVQLAIEITTKSQEARAQHVANREEEEAKGHLLRQKLKNEAESEAARKSLLLLQAESAAVETQGHATAEAKALAEAARIKGEADVRQAELHAQAMRIERAAALEARLAEQEADLAHKKALIDLEVSRETKMAQIEAEKFKATIDAIGASTIEAMARAGPEMQAKLLSGLGLQGYLITDGKSPINLFQTAGGMIATPGSASGAAAAGAGAGAGSFTGTTPTVAEAE